jgi:hypothetical protein
MTVRTSANAPYIYDGTQLEPGDRRVVRFNCDIESDDKTPAELFALAQDAHLASLRAEDAGHRFETDRQALTAATFDRIARERLEGE